MKILTCAMSPYVLTSNGCLNAQVLKYLYKNNHSVASTVWAHDITYHIPNEIDGVPNFNYKFNIDSREHKIPLFPFARNPNEVIQIYEVINRLEPDIFITIGDISEHLYMKAIRMFSTKNFKWFAILTNYQFPINKEHIELIKEADGILCTSRHSYESIRVEFGKDLIDWQFVGSRFDESVHAENNSNLKIFSLGKNCQSDNLECAMQIADQIRNSQMYIHTNVYDPGEINLESIKQMHIGNISFPETFVSLCDGHSDLELSKIMSGSDIYLSTSMVSGSSITAFEAISCGCFPLMTDSPCNRDLAEHLSEYFYPDFFDTDDFLIRSIRLLTTGEVYLYICDPQDAIEKINNYLSKVQKRGKGFRKELQNFSRKYRNDTFLDKTLQMMEKLENNIETPSELWVETS